MFRVNSIPQTNSLPPLRLQLAGTNGVRVTWAGIYGHGYRVERCSNLTTKNWQPIGATGGNPNGLTEFNDPAAAQPSIFYRVLPAL